MSTLPPGSGRVRRVLIAAFAVVLAAGIGACGSDDEPATGNPDDGTELTMWTRAGTEGQSKAFVEAYNAAHKNKVRLTVFPNEEYPGKIATSAGAKALPDIFTSDVVFAPNYVSQNLWQDISGRFGRLPFKDSVAPAHIKQGSQGGRQYAVPHTIDISVMLTNKQLYQRAGLDPEKGPTTLAEFAEHARKINSLGGGVKGTYFGGNCGGCLVFTFWPSVWADGGEVMNAEGTRSLVDGTHMGEVFGVYRTLFTEGVAAPGSKDESGPTWLGALEKGTIGIAPGPSAWLSLLEKKGLQVGVSAIPGVRGGESTFVGGDVAGVSATSSHAEQAWHFLSWTLSEQAQVEVLAKNKDVIARTDLASNKYSSQDPRVMKMNQIAAKGRTPYALKFNESYNDPQSAWVRTLRGALFGADPAKALKDGADAITKSLGG